MRDVGLGLLGVAVAFSPWVPEPHLVEKARWFYLWKGLGMTWLDAFDLVFHAAWLAVGLFLLVRAARRPAAASATG
jgi:hypothetical protein